MALTCDCSVLGRMIAVPIFQAGGEKEAVRQLPGLLKGLETLCSAVTPSHD